MPAFDKWLDKLVDEKGLDVTHEFKISLPELTHYVSLGVVIDACKAADASEQMRIKGMFIKIDFMNGNVLDYFQHLAKCLVGEG